MVLDSRNGTSLGRGRERVDELLSGLKRILWPWLILLVSWSSFSLAVLPCVFKEQTGMAGLGKHRSHTPKEVEF